jgi:hypothetical protein
MERMWQSFKEQETDLWNKQMSQLGTSDLTRVRRRVARPHLTIVQLKTFLYRQSGKLKGRIIHNHLITQKT